MIKMLLGVLNPKIVVKHCNAINYVRQKVSIKVSQKNDGELVPWSLSRNIYLLGEQENKAH
jgi:hypothetical protein